MSASMSLQELAHHVVISAATAPPDRRFVLGIAGPPGAGKSTLAAQLRDAVNAETGTSTAELAPMDGFHLDNRTLDARGIRSRKGAPDTFEPAAFALLLAALRASRPGRQVPFLAFDRELDRAVIGATFRDETIVITEGNYLLIDDEQWSRIGPILDESWYLDADIAVLRRRLIRRYVRGGRTSADAQERVSAIDEYNIAVVAASRQRADVTLTPTEGGRFDVRFVRIGEK